MGNGNPRLLVRVEPELAEGLEQLAKQKGMEVNELVRWVLRRVVESNRAT